MTQPAEESRATTIGLVVADGATVVLAWAAGCAYVFRRDLARWVIGGPEWLLAWLGGVQAVRPALTFVMWLFAGFALLGLVYALLWRLGLRFVRRGTEVGKPVREPDPAWSIVALVVIVAVGVGLRVRHLGAALDYDELVTAHFFIGAPTVWDALTRQVVFNNHPAYTLLARFSQEALGSTEFAVRLPAFVLGCLAMPVMWWAGRSALPAAGVLAATAAVAFHPLHVSYSHIARGYTGLALFGLIAVTLFDRVMRTGSRRATIAFVLASVCAAWFHLYGLWLLLVEALCVVALVVGSRLAPNHVGTKLTGPGFRAVWPALAMAGIGVVLVYGAMWPSLLWAVFARGRGAPGAGDWPVDGHLAEQVFLSMLGFGGWQWMVALPIGLSLAGTVGTPRLRPLLLGALLAVPLAITTTLRPADVGVRFFSYWIPFLALLLGAGVAVRIGRPGRMRVATAVVAAVAFAWVLAVWTNVVLAEVRDNSTRDAAHHAAAATTGRICTIGDAEILEFYLRDRLVSVGSVREFQRSPWPVCIIFDVPWLSPAARELVDHLMQTGQRRAFRDVVVFNVEH